MRNFYNNIHPFYGLVEKYLAPKMEIIVRERIAKIPNINSLTALEYGCGSGILSFQLAQLFRSVTARDLSIKMLERAKCRAVKRGLSIQFTEGNILQIDEQEKSFDYVFVSFALHLFPPEKVKEILSKLCLVARKGVIIIDHKKEWRLTEAIIEWMEGSYYNKFITMDFAMIAKSMGCKSFEENQIANSSVLSFYV